MKPVQIMLAVDDQQGIGRYLAFGPRLKNRHGMAVETQQLQHPGTRAFEIARVVHDDVQPPAADLAQECSQPIGAPRAAPPGLREVLIEDADMLPRQLDQSVDGFGLLGQRGKLDQAGLGGRLSRRGVGHGGLPSLGRCGEVAVPVH